MNIDFLNQISNYQKAGSQEIYWGSSVPSSPTNGAIWFEPSLTGISSSFPQPWIYNTAEALWLSQPIALTIPVFTVTTEANVYKFYPVRNYSSDSNKIYLQYFYAEILNLTATAHTSSNYWKLEIYRTVSTGAFSSVWESPSNSGFNFGSPSGLPASSPRHISHAVETFITGRTWDIGLNVIKTGTPPTGGMSVSSLITIRMSR